MDLDKLAAAIREHEGTGPVKLGRMMPYRDTQGLLSIGFGRCLDKIGITFDEADYMLAGDIAATVSAVTAALPIIFEALNDVRQRVLCEMAYNLGLAGLMGFKQMLFGLQQSDYNTAADAMLTSLWARQVGARAVLLAHMMRTGVE